MTRYSAIVFRLLGARQRSTDTRARRLFSGACALSFAASIGVAAISVLGEVSPAAALVLMLLGFPSAALSGVCLALAVGALLTRSSGLLLRMVLAAFLAGCGFVQSGRLTLGVPFYVKLQARPVVSSVLGFRPDGPYPLLKEGLPAEVRDVIERSGCFYIGRGPDFEVTCPGVAFTQCTYLSATDSWETWD